jgi:uncharacterized protein DUF3891
VIVREERENVVVITQPDHADLAARIIEHAAALTAHPRRDAILLAVREHDNGWAEEDAAPIVTAEGRIADFVNVPMVVRHRVWPRALARLEPHPWSAALVAQHAIVVYDRFRREAEWASFFAGLEAARDRLVKTGTLSFEDLRSDYRFLRLADLISLTFCTGSSDPQHFGEWTVKLTGDRVVVAPDPFDGLRIPVAVRAREIPSRRYASDADLRAALSAACEIVVRGGV